MTQENYTVFFEVCGKTFKMKYKASSEKEAKEKAREVVMNSFKFDYATPSVVSDFFGETLRKIKK